jgi:Tfp pilus tip-associated adhesin PilY1
MLSIETPMQGTAHPPIICTGDPRTSYGCTFASCSYTVSGRRVDNCYDNNKTYYGYFDPNKCYNYVGGGTGARFEPVGLATNHQCSGSWSGNFLNWATTMAVDAFRKAMTGGNRAVDSTGNTQLLGARQTLSPGHNWFPIKRIDNANFYTPYTGTIYLIRYANGFVVCRDTNNDGLPDCGVGQSGSGENLFPTVSNKQCSNDVFKACNTNSDCGSGATCQTVSGAVSAFNLKIEVCNPSKGLEPNCNPSNNKPEGVIQKYADKMRFGLISYALSGNPDMRRDGGVIRANMKWISPKIPYGMKYHDANGDLVVCNNAGGCPNPEAEINADGTFISNPDNIGGADFSGVINYINKFGYNAGYKSYDPISEMYYEIVRYFKKLGPSTDNYCTGLPTKDDGAPVYCNYSPWSHTNRLGWRDPYIYPCQKSFVVAINDANPWLDKRIPGTAKTSETSSGPARDCAQCVGDFGAPSNADTSINVSYWTDLVGNYEGLTPGNMCIGCVLGGSCDWNATSKYVTQLSKAFGTCPYPGKENSYYIAGLSYYAHQTDLRSDLPGNQTLKTYMIDTQEANPNMLVGRTNMLYLAAKFGNFDDANGNGRPDLTSEWDKDNDGFPDAYFFASDPTKIEEGLNKAFADILRRASSGATVATLTSRTGISSLIVQPYYYPKYIRQDGTEVSWLGFLRSFWIDVRQNLREDTTEPKVLNMAGAAIDKIFQFFFDPNNNETKVAILQGSDTTSSCVREGVKSINEVIPVFDAGCQLADRDPSTRNILYNKNGTLTSFTTSEASNFNNIWKVCSNDPTVLCTNNGDCGGGTCQPANASCIIRYLRGEDLSSDSSCPDYVKRTREVNISEFCPGASGTKTWRIGDIINSTPSVVSSEPVNIYHLRYNDTTYLQYIRTDAYKNRTSFVFVGANDGMLHAFRVGRLVQTGDPDKPTKVVNAYNTTSNDLVGREEWAFIPRNALPYLVWYGNPNYCRVPTVDYRTAIFDASINGPANADRTVSSWRTILIGTMGFGGRSITTSAGTFSSSVFALDLTDWLNGTSAQPTLLWEISLPDGTLTTAYPAVVRLGDPNKNGEWYVVIGSGPLNPNGTSFTSQSKLYFIDLRNGNIVKNVNIPATGVNFAVGDIAVVDVDSDYQDDVIYFGAYGKTNAGNVWGNFYRLSLRSGTGYKSVSALTSSDICTAIDLGTFATAGNTPPVFGAPNFTKDEFGRLWVFFGTGRYVMDSSDKAISYDNYLIGFKDENWNSSSSTCPTPYTRAQLADVTNQSLTITITEVKQICMCDAGGCGMRNVVYGADGSIPTEPTRGWYYRLTGEAIYSQALVIGGIVDALTYVPPQDICQMEGSSNLISVYYKTGRPYPRPSVLSPYAVSGTIAVGQSAQLLQKISVGQGIPPIGNPFQALQSSQASQQLEKFAQISTGVVLRITQQKSITSEEKFLLWIEK